MILRVDSDRMVMIDGALYHQIMVDCPPSTGISPNLFYVYLIGAGMQVSYKI